MEGFKFSTIEEAVADLRAGQHGPGIQQPQIHALA